MPQGGDQLMVNSRPAIPSASAGEKNRGRWERSELPSFRPATDALHFVVNVIERDRQQHGRSVDPRVHSFRPPA